MPIQPIPQANILLSQSQTQILNNFTSIATMMTPNAGAPNGGQLQFPERAGDPAAIASTPQMYAKLGTTINAPNVVAQTEIFIERADGTVPTHGFTEAVKQGIGWTFLPSGIILQWGTANLVGADVNGTVVPFPIQFPTACLNVQLTLSTNAGGQSRTVYVIALAQANFTAATKNSQSNNRNDGTVYWFAIGY